MLIYYTTFNLYKYTTISLIEMNVRPDSLVKSGNQTFQAFQVPIYFFCERRGRAEKILTFREG